LPRLLNGAEIIVMVRLRGIRSAGHVHARTRTLQYVYKCLVGNS